MKFLHFALMLLGSIVPVSTADNGLVHIPSKYSVPGTLDRLESVVK